MSSVTTNSTVNCETNCETKEIEEKDNVLSIVISDANFDTNSVVKRSIDILDLLVSNDTTYYKSLVDHELIKREHIHFASTHQQITITTWWRVNPCYDEKLEKQMLYDCNISFTHFKGMRLLGTIETERIELYKNINFKKLLKMLEQAPDPEW